MHHGMSDSLASMLSYSQSIFFRTELQKDIPTLIFLEWQFHLETECYIELHPNEQSIHASLLEK